MLKSLTLLAESDVSGAARIGKIPSGFAARKRGEPLGSEMKSTETNKPATDVATANLACSKCGASLPEEAQFCLKCGKPVSAPPKRAAIASGAVVESPQSMLPRPRQKRRVVLWVLLGLVLIAIVWAATSDNPFAQGAQELAGWKHDQTILETEAPFVVAAHSFRYYKFALPEGSLHVSIVGQFSASSDSHNANRNNKDKGNNSEVDNDLEVYVLSEPAFTVWQNGYATSSVYESGKVSQGTLQAELPAGAGIYYLVFSNKLSPKTAKSVNASVLLRYKSWVPGWVRSLKERFTNWMAL
ncbi:MAG TPA: zinc ribbon domain-containing protein [Terriglobales bacterium]|nr:zinc ribbon domain-containing protein [Terriglobales bacterium]